MMLNNITNANSRFYNNALCTLPCPTPLLSRSHIASIRWLHAFKLVARAIFIDAASKRGPPDITTYAYPPADRNATRPPMHAAKTLRHRDVQRRYRRLLTAVFRSFGLAVFCFTIVQGQTARYMRGVPANASAPGQG